MSSEEAATEKSPSENLAMQIELQNSSGQKLDWNKMLDLAWKIGVIVLLLGRGIFTTDRLAADITEIKTRLDHMSSESSDINRRLSTLEGSSQSMQRQLEQQELRVERPSK